MPMIIDLHAHSSGISKCCRISYDGAIDKAIELGLDGIVLTNHYQRSYLENTDTDGFVEKYIGEFLEAKEYGKTKGFKVFFGIEITMEQDPKIHMLVYGVPFEFLRENPEVFALSQGELYALVKSYGGVLVQAHPFRNGADVLDVDFLDGIEINCHPKYEHTFADRLMDIARKNKLQLTCGGDFHNDTDRPKCGIFVPDNISDSIELGKFISEKQETILYIQEPDSEICEKALITINQIKNPHKKQI